MLRMGLPLALNILIKLNEESALHEVVDRMVVYLAQHFPTWGPATALSQAIDEPEQ